MRMSACMPGKWNSAVSALETDETLILPSCILLLCILFSSIGRFPLKRRNSIGSRKTAPETRS